MRPYTVFISSTGLDLIDLRAELAEHLESQGFLVSRFERPSEFQEAPRLDTVGTCLANVERADVVVVVLHQRYGWCIPASHPMYGGRSVTHAEYLHSVSADYHGPLKTGRLVLFCIRDHLKGDYDLWKANPTLRAKQRYPWVAKGETKLLEMVDERYTAAAPGVSNWVNVFSTSRDLKELLSSRLRREAIRARYQKLSEAGQIPVLIPIQHSQTPNKPRSTITVSWTNPGPSPVFNIRVSREDVAGMTDWELLGPLSPGRETVSRTALIFKHGSPTATCRIRYLTGHGFEVEAKWGAAWPPNGNPVIDFRESGLVEEPPNKL